ncbi:hypothetical protein WN943_000134 [Citrus x changshan-huyou]
MASAQNHGTATYYTPPYIPSACYGFADQGVMIAAASEAIWNGGGACGQYYQVTSVRVGAPLTCHKKLLLPLLTLPAVLSTFLTNRFELLEELMSLGSEIFTPLYWKIDLSRSFIFIVSSVYAI